MFINLNTVFPFVAVLLLACKLPTACRWDPLEKHGCSYYNLSSTDWCTSYTFNKPKFSFYIRPLHGLKGITIKLTRTDLAGYEWYVNLNIPMDFIQSSEKWYHVQFRETWHVYRETDYNIVIDGNSIYAYKIEGFRPSRFNIIFKGSGFIGVTCKPTENHPQSTRKPIQTVVTPEENGGNEPVIPETELAPESPGNMVDENETTENDYPPTLYMVDSNNSTLTGTVLLFGEPRWVTVLTGLSFFTIIVCIIVSTVYCRKLIAMSKEESRRNENQSGINNRTFSPSSTPETHTHDDRDGRTSTTRQPFGNGHNATTSFQRTQEASSPNCQRNAYGTQLANSDTENIYENIQTPNASAHVNEGHLATHYGAMDKICTIYSTNNTTGQVNRGSSHDSENSLYGFI